MNVRTFAKTLNEIALMTFITLDRHFVGLFGLLWVVVALSNLSRNVAASPAYVGRIALSFGSNENGQLGIGTPFGHAPIATPIDRSNLAGKRVAQVSAGGSHSLLLTTDGSVFSFGLNVYGPTGLGQMVPPLPASTLVATQIDGTNLNGNRVVQVAAGGLHSLLLTEDGTALSFGRNSPGQLDTSDLYIATPIDTSNLGSRKVTQVAAGALHSLILTDDGSVFSFAVRSSSELGRTGISLIAAQIDDTNLAGRKVTQVAAGAGYSLLLTEDGTVFSFGSNNAGRTGQGATTGMTAIATPIDTSKLGDKKIVQLSAGEAHSLLLTHDGTVFSFGENFFGKTGIGAPPSTSSTLVATPIDTTNLTGVRIVEVRAGSEHSLLLADDGRAFSFGSNSIGQLGIDNFTAPRYIATPIDTTNFAGHRVASISAGYDHNILLVVPECQSALLLTQFGFAIAFRFRRRESSMQQTIELFVT